MIEPTDQYTQGRIGALNFLADDIARAALSHRSAALGSTHCKNPTGAGAYFGLIDAYQAVLQLIIATKYPQEPQP